ncbi:hypothetical protein RvY_01446-2 [Ramazzottius varieornatus]|uniref:Uncharacterized protein n=1 Tax=Ramazzottius varieornatus TaxID=947166 RepID=A0A1D1UGP5_RAMVA|nr:hypothetical protein RvY_01446-2 [Ramazzottius varieornatus]
MLLNSMSEKRPTRLASQTSRFSASLSTLRSDRQKCRHPKVSPPVAKHERKKVLRQILHNAEVYMDGVKRCDEILRSLPPLTTERQEYVEKWLTESSSTEFDGTGTPTMSPSGASTAVEERSTQRSGPSRKLLNLPAKSSSTLTDRSRTGSAISKNPSLVSKSRDAGKSADRISTISEEIQTVESRHSSVATAVQVSVGHCPVHSCTCNAEGVTLQTKYLACPSHPAPEKPKRLHPCTSVSNTTDHAVEVATPSETQPETISAEATPASSEDSVDGPQPSKSQVETKSLSDEPAEPAQPGVHHDQLEDLTELAELTDSEPEVRITDGNIDVLAQFSEETFDEKPVDVDQEKEGDADEPVMDDRKAPPAFDRTVKLGRRHRFSFRLPMKNRLHRNLTSYISWQKPGPMPNALPQLPPGALNHLPAAVTTQSDNSLKEMVTQNKELVTSISNIFAALQTHVQRSDEDRRMLIDILNISESKNFPATVSAPLRQEVVTDAAQTTSLISLSSRDHTTIQSTKTSAGPKVKPSESTQGRKKEPRSPPDFSSVTKCSSSKSSVLSSRGTPNRMAPPAPVLCTSGIKSQLERKTSSQGIDVDNVESSDNSAVYGTPRHSVTDSLYSGSKEGSANRLHSKRSTSSQPAEKAEASPPSTLTNSVKTIPVMDSPEKVASAEKHSNRKKTSGTKSSSKTDKSGKPKNHKASLGESSAVEQHIDTELPNETERETVPQVSQDLVSASDHHSHGMVPTESARTFYISSSSSGRNTDKMPTIEQGRTTEHFSQSEQPRNFPVVTASTEQACQTSDNAGSKAADEGSAPPSVQTASESDQTLSSAPRRKLPPLGVASRDHIETRDRGDTFHINISDSTMVDSETGMTFHPMQSNGSASEIEERQQHDAPVGNSTSVSSEEPSKLHVSNC